MYNDLNRPLVSIIIPVYNCERYIHKCIQSIIAQTYSNLEIIIIDDGSTDNSGEICDYLARKDHRIKVVHQENSGPGMARNTGLSYVSGNYLAFIDADDYVSKHYIQKMITLAYDYQADIVEVSSVWMLPLKNRFHSSNIQIQQFDGKQELISDYFSSNRRLQNTLWGRLFRWNVIQDIRFSDKSIAEDSEYSLKAFTNCRKLVKSNEVLYVYRAYTESITRRRLSSKHFDLVDLLVKEMLFCESVNVRSEDWQFWVDRFIIECKGLLSKIAEEKRENEFNNEIDNMRKYLAIVTQIAIRHNVVVDESLKIALSDISVWAKNYRRISSIKFVVKWVKRTINEVFRKIKVKINYEYPIDKR